MNDTPTPDAQKNAAAEETVAYRKSHRGGRVKRILLITLAVIVALLIAAVAALFILRGIGASKFKPAIMKEDKVKTVDKAVAYDEGKTIVYKDKTYVYNDDVIHLAFLGIDKTELEKDAPTRRRTGQSDTNMVVALDTATGRVSLVVIPRDTMADVDVLADDGSLVGISKLQLCLAYSYGDGLETSCENALTSMERLLYGIEVDNYYALDLDGIAALNDAVGGVEVTAIETIPGISEGERVTLSGKDAVRYVQYRDKSIFNSDSMRRQRQIQYAKAFLAKAFSMVKGDLTFANTLLDTAGGYSCTNIDFTRAIYLISELANKRDSLVLDSDDIRVLSGEATMGEKFMEIYLDETAVFETILDVFYTEKQ